MATRPSYPVQRKKRGRGPDLAKQGLDMRLLLTPIACAQLLSISESQVRRMIQRGAIPSLRLGRCRLIPREQLNAWIAEKVEAERLTHEWW